MAKGGIVVIFIFFITVITLYAAYTDTYTGRVIDNSAPPQPIANSVAACAKHFLGDGGTDDGVNN